jgi:hypothetical protein
MSFVTSGIPQGSVLGPILFVIYINNKPEMVESSTYLFADDTKIFREIREEKDPEMKPNCLLLKSLLVDMCFTIVSLTSFSMVLQITLVRLTGLYFPGSVLSPYNR